ncbi:hypothetical protein NQ318_017709, partial [Aromia moschata]
MRELHTQNPEKVNVWAGIIGQNIIGPFFIDGNLNGETYLALLQNNVRQNVCPPVLEDTEHGGGVQYPLRPPTNPLHQPKLTPER